MDETKTMPTDYNIMQTTNNLVSIMMPAYNAEQFLAEAIESVLPQTYPHWELLVVNDGSTDDTAVIAQRYTADPRVRLIHKENGGESSARNVALDNSRGAFVAYLDADDAWLPHHLETLVGYLQAHPERDAVYADGWYYDPAGNRGHLLSTYRRGPFEGDLFAELALASDVFGPPICVVLRRDLVERHHLRYDERIVIGPDWEFFTRYAALANFGCVPEPVCLYRVHETNITMQVGNKRRAGYLALCRESAIRHERFGDCPAETRTAVFYDLLINLLAEQPERQTAVIQWPQFAALPAGEQARLLRLMASQAILNGENAAPVQEWLRRARLADNSDRIVSLLAATHKISPALSRRILSLRRQARPEAPEAFSPFGDLV